jgi:hypothetical protein
MVTSSPAQPEPGCVDDLVVGGGKDLGQAR